MCETILVLILYGCLILMGVCAIVLIWCFALDAWSTKKFDLAFKLIELDYQCNLLLIKQGLEPSEYSYAPKMSYWQLRKLYKELQTKYDELLTSGVIKRSLEFQQEKESCGLNEQR